jgi:glyoxylase-like metal-dependent hydrolase (beta-lactamase superfamily II)
MHTRVSRPATIAVIAGALAASFAGAGVEAQDQAAPRANPDNSDIQVLPVTPTVYMLIGGGGNITLQVEPPTRPARTPGTYIGPYGVLLVDSGLAPASDRVRAAVRRISQGPIRYIINTHIHADHIGGNENLARPAAGRGMAATILSHENMLLQLATPEGNEARLPQGGLPTDAYLDVKETWFNGESIQVIHQPGAHTDGDSIVYFRKSDVISAGDIFSTDAYPIVDAQRHGSFQGIIEGLNRILDLAVPESNAEGGTKIIPGHGRLSDESDVVEYRNMAVIIRDRIQDMVKKGMTLEQVKAAKPSLDYDFRYGATSGRWTTDMFIEAIYTELKAAAPARPAPAGRGRSGI